MTATKRSKGDHSLSNRTTVDLGKLRKASLKRYKKHFKLDCKADSKTDLVEVVMRHFAAMPVREADVALEFHNFARTVRGRRMMGGDSLGPGGVAHQTAVTANDGAGGR